jgi:DNA (cytosine-5)-methyltransferase 1
MRYSAQYVYRCPARACRLGQVYPLAVPADAILDYALPTQLIGERKKPLKPKTRARIAGGIWRHRERFLAGSIGHPFQRRPGVHTWPATRPLVTQHTTAALGLVMTSGGGWESHPTPTDQPLHTVTTTEKDALVVPLEGRDGLRARPVSEPLRSQTTRHQDGVVGLPTMVIRGNEDRDEMCTPIDEPIRTLTIRAHQSVVQGSEQPALYVPLRNNGNARLTEDAVRLLRREGPSGRR